MKLIPDDPIISRIERTGYAHNYEAEDEPYWIKAINKTQCKSTTGSKKW